MAAILLRVSRLRLGSVVVAVVLPLSVVLLTGCVWGGDAKPTDGSLAVQVRLPEQPGGTVSALDVVLEPYAVFFIADTSLLESDPAHVEDYYYLVLDTWEGNQFGAPAQPTAVSVPSSMSGYVQGVVGRLSAGTASGYHEFAGLPAGNRYLVAVGAYFDDGDLSQQGWSWDYVVIPEDRSARIALTLDSHLNLDFGWWLTTGDTFDYFLDQEYGAELF